MEVENTPENKAKLFSLYFDQMVYTIDYNNKPVIYRNFGNRADEQVKGLYKEAYLSLTPISQISDEDAIEVARILNLGHLSGAVRKLVISLLESLDRNSQATTMFISQWIKVVDYLRSRGYYVGDGTEIDYEWVKLKK